MGSRTSRVAISSTSCGSRCAATAWRGCGTCRGRAGSPTSASRAPMASLPRCSSRSAPFRSIAACCSRATCARRAAGRGAHTPSTRSSAHSVGCRRRTPAATVARPPPDRLHRRWRRHLAHVPGSTCCGVAAGRWRVLQRRMPSSITRTRTVRRAWSSTWNCPTWTAWRCMHRMAADRDALPIIFVTSHGDVPAIVRAMKAGAFELFAKPLPMTPSAGVGPRRHLLQHAGAQARGGGDCT